MIYVDASVALAEILAEDRHPGADFWNNSLISSRLLQYEVWTRLHAHRGGAAHTALARVVLGRVALAELSEDVLARALEPFPVAVRTLDALHLATIEFLRGEGAAPHLATYDARMRDAAERLRIALYAW